MKPNVKTALWMLGACMALGFLLNFSAFMAMSAPVFLGTLLGGSLAYWALGGLTVFFCRPDNVRWYWPMVSGVMMAVGSLG